jgi:hypothetical protein
LNFVSSRSAPLLEALTLVFLIRLDRSDGFSGPIRMALTDYDLKINFLALAALKTIILIASFS